MMNNLSQIKVLFDEQVIPNYRIGIFKKLAAYPDIELTVSYWLRRAEDSPPHMDKFSGFDTISFDPIQWNYSGRNLWLNLDLFRYVLKKRPSVVIGRFNMFGINTVISFALERICKCITGTKFVYRVSRGMPKGAGRWNRSLRSAWYKAFFCNAIVSTYGQRAAAAVISQGCSSDRVFVDYNSMDTEELLFIRRELKRSSGEWIQEFLSSYGIVQAGFVLFAGRVYPEKRIDVLVNAWKMLVLRGYNMQNRQLVIVGSGPGKEKAIELSKDLGNFVVFVEGIWDTKQLSKFYYLSDLVVFPGAGGLSINFAMCFGKPVICSQYGNEVEYIGDGINGYIYDCGNIEQLAEKIITLLRNKDLQRRFGLSSERLVREKININHMIQTIYGAVTKAIS